MLPVDVRTGARAGESRPAVVICHGFKGFKDWGFFPKLAERLATAGFTAVSFNVSGSGVSGGDVFDEPVRWLRQRPSWDLADVGTVVDWAVSGGAPWVGLVGHSRGGGLAILQAARDPRVRALVTWNAIDHFLRWPEEEIARWRRDGRIDVVNARTGQVLPIGRDALDDIDAHGADGLDVLGAAGRVTVPWLLVHGLADQTVPVGVARTLAARASGPVLELLLLEGADHTFGIRHPWAGSTAVFDEVLERTVGHLARAS
jgi:dienelactone hydrolase